MFILQAKTGEPHSIRPQHNEILSGIDSSKAQVLALINLGVIDSTLAGHTVPSVAYFVNEPLRLKKV